MKARKIISRAILAAVVAAMVTVACPGNPRAAETVGAQEVEVTPPLVREIQFMLLRLGIDLGPIDGVVGPQTASALLRFEQQAGLPTAQLVGGGRISAALLARLRNDASRVIFEG